MTASHLLSADDPTDPLHGPEGEPASQEVLQPAQVVSALLDAEALPHAAWPAAWQQVRGCPDAVQDWHAQLLIGAVLRGQRACDAVPLHSEAALAFAQRVTELARQAGEPRDAERAAAHGQAGRPSAMSAPGRSDRLGAPADAPVRDGGLKRPAANDGVFRWKAVAGLASVSAVLSLAWGVWQSSGEPPAVAMGTPVPTVQATAAAPGTSTMAVAGSPTVLVQTGQGLVERDARLDALIQAHRQHGGASAWQLPAGFVRAAVQDGAAGR